MKRLLCILACLALLFSASGCDRLQNRLQSIVDGDQYTETEIGLTDTAPAPISGEPSLLTEVAPGSGKAKLAPLEPAHDTEYEMFETGTLSGGAYAPIIQGTAPNIDFYDQRQNNDEYPALSETGFAVALTSPLSTFAADVDTAAYANIRRMIRQQQTIPPDAVRIEEMINAFTYHYPAPEGDAPVAISTQVSVCPWNEKNLLLRVGLKAQPIDTADLPPSNLVFLIDVSGSMDEASKLPLVQRSFTLLTEQLTVRDRVSIVVYAGRDAVVLSGVRGDEQARILEAIAEPQAGGGTNGAAGLMTAYQEAARYAGESVNSRVILATDGDFNIGVSSESELIRLIEAEREKGIFLTVLGFGYGNYKDTNLEALADHGNGNATYIDSIHQARCALVEEMGATLNTVAKDVKIQVEFNPAVVTSYRLIGYENRRLAAEDFADDTKDGGEMGAGHCVTALYELALGDSETATTSPLTYQQQTTTDSNDYATVHVRYKQPQGDVSTEIVHAVDDAQYTDTPDADFRLASAIAAFGQLLSGSKFSGSADQRMIQDQLQPLLSEDAGGRIVELYDLVRTSGGLYAPQVLQTVETPGCDITDTNIDPIH